MRQFGLIIIAFMSSIVINAATNNKEIAKVITDKECYVAGECVNVSLCIVNSNEDSTKTFSNAQASSSKVAYVEICDNRKMVAQSMVAIENGRGWANISLPLTMHSGNYQLAVYTNEMRNHGPEVFTRKLISVVNPTKVSRIDNIAYMPTDSADAKVISRYGLDKDVYGTFNCGETVNISSLGMSNCIYSTATVSRCDLCVQEYSDIPSLKPQRHIFRKFIPEIEGHIVSAKKIGKEDIDETRIVMVGKNSILFDGMQQNDSTYLYFTNRTYGNLPTLINAYDKNGKAVAIEVESPYANVIPKELPKLTVYCSENELQGRSITAQKEKAVYDFVAPDTLQHSYSFMTVEPLYFYDLDEYTKFHTVREILIEFVRGIRRRKHNGVNKLFTFNTETRRLADWPSLVLLDGMPVHDIDDILHYDGHLLKYVQIYPDSYTFGNSIVNGVISFISKKGRLSNFKLDEGSKLMQYTFPQYKQTMPSFDRGGYGTIYWNPDVKGDDITFTAPTLPGRYNIVCQGLDKNGEIIREVKVIEVR